MTALWVIGAFLVGCFVWHKIGTILTKKVLGKDYYTRKIIGSVSTETLPKLLKSIENEMERRRKALS